MIGEPELDGKPSHVICGKKLEESGRNLVKEQHTERRETVFQCICKGNTDETQFSPCKLLSLLSNFSWFVSQKTQSGQSIIL